MTVAGMGEGGAGALSSRGQLHPLFDPCDECNSVGLESTFGHTSLDGRWYCVTNLLSITFIPTWS